MENVIAIDGIVLDLEPAAMTFSYNVDGTISYCEVSDFGNTYRQTFGYTNGQL
jgi:hypothetical protein